MVDWDVLSNGKRREREMMEGERMFVRAEEFIMLVMPTTDKETEGMMQGVGRLR